MTPPCFKHADVISIDAIVTAAYDVISGPAGQRRDWVRERSLFLEGARLIPTSAAPGSADSKAMPRILDVETYIARCEPFFQSNGFFEKEVARRTEQFGNVAHVWSTYESRRDPADPEPFMRMAGESIVDIGCSQHLQILKRRIAPKLNVLFGGRRAVHNKDRLIVY